MRPQLLRRVRAHRVVLRAHVATLARHRPALALATTPALACAARTLTSDAPRGRAARALRPRRFEPGDVEHPRPPGPEEAYQGNWVSDAPQILSPESTAAINRDLEALNATTRVEFAVVLLEDVAGFDRFTEPAAYGDFSRRLFDLWGVGREGVNDGVLLVLFRGGRRVEVVTGAAVVGALPDVWLRNMQVSAMVPHFKAGDYGAGVEAGVKAIVAKLADFEAPGAGDLLQAHYAASDRGYELEGRRFWLRQGEAGGQSQDDGSLLSPPRDARERERALSRATFGGGRQGGHRGDDRDESAYGSEGGHRDGSDNWAFAQGIGAVCLFPAAILGMEYAERRAERRRRRTCPKCNVVMTTVATWDKLEFGKYGMVSGFRRASDGARSATYELLLTECEKLEAKLGACAFEVLHCPQCNAESKLREPSFYSGYSPCPKCDCRTCSTSSRTLRTATEYSTGERAIETTCAHCAFYQKRYDIIPKRPPPPPPSSSRSSGGFGGGSSSGGGGAGASWMIDPGSIASNGASAHEPVPRAPSEYLQVAIAWLRGRFGPGAGDA